MLGCKSTFNGSWVWGHKNIKRLTFLSRKVTKLPKFPERNGQATVCGSVGTGLDVAAQKLVLEMSRAAPEHCSVFGKRLFVFGVLFVFGF